MLLRDLITGNNGLNYWIRYFLRTILLLLENFEKGKKGLNEWVRSFLNNFKRRSDNQDEKEQKVYPLGIEPHQITTFHQWLQETGINHEMEWITVKDGILLATLTATEFCVIWNYLLLVADLLIIRVSSTSFFGYTNLLVNLIFCCLFFFLSWAYDRYYYKMQRKNRLEKISKDFKISLAKKGEF